MEWLQVHWVDVVAIAGAVVLSARTLLTVGTLISKLTDTPKDDEVVTTVRKFVDRVVGLLKLVGLHVE